MIIETIYTPNTASWRRRRALRALWFRTRLFCEGVIDVAAPVLLLSASAAISIWIFSSITFPVRLAIAVPVSLVIGVFVAALLRAAGRLGE